MRLPIYLNFFESTLWETNINQAQRNQNKDLFFVSFVTLWFNLFIDYLSSRLKSFQNSLVVLFLSISDQSLELQNII
jgi:hypothetical protein